MKKYNVNKKNAFRLAYVIEQNEEHFDMRFWGFDGENDIVATKENLHKCGTTACIAGWAVALAPEKAIWFGENDVDHVESANKFLLNDCATLYGVYFERDMSHRQAVNMLRNLALTGVVDWEASLNPLQVLYARIRGAINI